MRVWSSGVALSAVCADDGRTRVLFALVARKFGMGKAICLWLNRARTARVASDAIFLMLVFVCGAIEEFQFNSDRSSRRSVG